MATKVLARSDSHSGLREKLQSAIAAKHGSGSEYSYMGDASVHDVFPNKVVHTIAGKRGKMFASKYALDDKGKVSIGDPEAVEPAYKPLNEAIQGWLGEATEFKEAQYDKTSGKLQVRVIQPGFNTSKTRFYPASTLKKYHKIFEGAKMFANHQTAAEAKARPEGDVRDWVANLTEASVAPDGSIVGVAQVHDPIFKEKLAGLQEAGLLNEMGISIRAAGLQQEAEVQGTKTMWVESFTVSKSVDFVTYPGAGGRVEMMESEQDELDFITPERLATLRPDLVKHFTEAAREAANVEKTTEQLQADLAESNRLLTEANGRIKALEESTKKVVVAGKLTALLTEAKLPAPAETRIKAQFAEATEEAGIAEAIAAEKAYIAELGVQAKPNLNKPTGVRNMGESANQPVVPANDVRERSIAAWMKTGMTKEMAETAVGNLS